MTPQMLRESFVVDLHLDPTQEASWVRVTTEPYDTQAEAEKRAVVLCDGTGKPTRVVRQTEVIVAKMRK